MLFAETDLPGVYRIDLDLKEDERGFFARTWCRREFEAQGLNPRLVQCSVSFNKARGTLRGMHYQAHPHREDKLVRCIGGSIYDVVVDLRPSSPTFLRWTAVELTAKNRSGLYIPGGCAHGFQTLEADTEVFYQISEFYDPAANRGIRWDDPAVGITWPMPPAAINERDLGYELIGEDITRNL